MIRNTQSLIIGLAASIVFMFAFSTEYGFGFAAGIVSYFIMNKIDQRIK